jgi:hypothetical protein
MLVLQTFVYSLNNFHTDCLVKVKMSGAPSAKRPFRRLSGRTPIVIHSDSPIVVSDDSAPFLPRAAAAAAAAKPVSWAVPAGVAGVTSGSSMPGLSLAAGNSNARSLGNLSGLSNALNLGSAGRFIDGPDFDRLLQLEVAARREYYNQQQRRATERQNCEQMAEEARVAASNQAANDAMQYQRDQEVEREAARVQVAARQQDQSEARLAAAALADFASAARRQAAPPARSGTEIFIESGSSDSEDDGAAAPAASDSQAPKLIGQGGYGCVYKPPLPCNEPCTDPRCRNGVSKLTTRRTARMNFEAYDVLALIPDEREQFFIKRPYVCRTNPKWTETCEGVPDLKRDPHLMFFTDGGINLSTLINQRPLRVSPVNIIRGLTNLMEGLHLIHRIPSQHADLKPWNIVTGVNGDHFRLIDFDLLIAPQNMNTPDPLFTHPYRYYPLDVILATATQVSDTEIMQHVNKVFKVNSAYVNADRGQWIRFLQQLRDEGITIQQIKSKIDVYSLGMTIEDIAEHVHHIYPRLETDLRQFIKDINFVDNGRKPDALKISMIHPDPRRRPNMLDVYKQFVKSFRIGGG